MDDYISLNKRAWENAYQHSTSKYKDIVTPLKKDPSHYIPDLLSKHLDPADVKERSIAQLACNNGREILSIGLTHHASKMTGIDIAENMVEAAQKSAKALNAPAEFFAQNILELDSKWDAQFDTIFVLIGVLYWFKSVKDFFQVIQRLLKPGGRLYLMEGHPMTNVFAFENEVGYRKDAPFSPVHSYFKTTPFMDDDGMSYMTDDTYQSPTFVSHVHTFEAIIEGLIHQGFVLEHFKEDNTNYLGTFPELDGQGVPLVFFIKAKKIG